MSRIGRSPILVPSGVSLTIEPEAIKVDGPKGILSQKTLSGLSFDRDGEFLIVKRANDEKTVRSQHGLMRSLIQNMVTGVSQGFSKKLEINGVGYRAAISGSDLRMQLGFSHEVVYSIPTGVNVGIDQNVITINGIDKQLVGQVAAEIRSYRKPEPYKGKGIKYVDERIIRKSGKSGKEKA